MTACLPGETPKRLEVAWHRVLQKQDYTPLVYDDTVPSLPQLRIGGIGSLCFANRPEDMEPDPNRARRVSRASTAFIQLDVNNTSGRSYQYREIITRSVQIAKILVDDLQLEKGDGILFLDMPHRHEWVHACSHLGLEIIRATAADVAIFGNLGRLNIKAILLEDEMRLQEVLEKLEEWDIPEPSLFEPTEVTDLTKILDNRRDIKPALLVASAMESKPPRPTWATDNEWVFKQPWKTLPFTVTMQDGGLVGM